MDALVVLIGIALAVSTVHAADDNKGACYEFKGTGRVVFHYSHDFATEAHFSLAFRTSASAGVLYYAGGTFNKQRVFDYEGLFIDDGILYYFLYNPGEYSRGSSSGFFGASKKKVNDGNWHTAEITRNVKVETKFDNGSRSTGYQTSLRLDGKLQAEDNRPKFQVNIFQPISLGRDPHESERFNPFPGFKGSIKEFKDVSRKEFLKGHTKEGLVTHCIATSSDDVQAN